MAGLSLYRGLTELGAPLIDMYMRRRLSNGKEDPDRIAERWGIPPASAQRVLLLGSTPPVLARRNPPCR